MEVRERVREGCDSFEREEEKLEVEVTKTFGWKV